MAKRGPLTGELEALYRQRYRHLLRVAIAIVGDEAGGHDAVQEGFARALREQQSFRGDGPVEAWVWRTVVNAALAARRRQVARPDAPEAVGDCEREWTGRRLGCSGAGWPRCRSGSG